jgi:hypothetical protein
MLIDSVENHLSSTFFVKLSSKKKNSNEMKLRVNSLVKFVKFSSKNLRMAIVTLQTISR